MAGMFLYARLVLDGVFSRSNLRDLREEACNLPDGLDEALVDLIPGVVIEELRLGCSDTLASFHESIEI
jgi:hypothetical protein